MSDSPTIDADKRKKVAKIVTAVFLAVLFVFYVCCQIYLVRSKSSISTEIALYDEIVDSIPVDMFIVRDEKIITSDVKNIVSAVPDGTRVSSNDTVAYAFSDSSSAGNVIRMGEIQQELEYYIALSNKSAATTDDTTLYDNKIADSIIDFASISSSGNLSSLGKIKNEILDSIVSRQTATGVELDLSSAISSLQSEYASLQNTTSGFSKIESGGSGYYISGSDGYENLLNYSNASNWTVTEVEDAINATPKNIDSQAVGRIAHNYYWYLVCVTDTENANNLKEGSTKTISFSESSAENIRATVYRITPDPISKKSVIVFSCNTMNEELSTLRCEAASIHVREYSGYKIDNNAIHENENGEKGVYIISGSVIRFRLINIVYSSQDFSIVTNPKKEDASKSGTYLNLYDEYIINGTDLYDGKLIN